MTTLPARYIGLLCDALDRDGIPTLLSRNACAITMSPASTDGALDAPTLERFVAIAHAESGRGDLGFELGRHLRLNDHDLLGYGLLSCATLDELLRLAASCYAAITGLFALRYTREPHCGDAIYTPAVALNAQALRFCLEAVAVAHCTQLRALFGSHVACEVRIGMEAPPHAGRYKGFAPARVTFDPSEPGSVRVRMSDALLRQGLGMPSPAVVERVMRHYADRGEATRTRALVPQVTELLREQDRLLTRSDIARRLGTSTRTLARRLESAGQPFRVLARRVRWELALRWLATEGTTIAEVAYRLGYSDSTNFARAFKRATGKTPSQAQREARAALPGGSK